MRDKFAIREEVWTALEQAKVVRGRTVHDKIPDFYGSKEAAERVFDLEVWQRARVIKSNPDKAQRPLRQQALEEGKLLYMAVPRLRDERCFVELDPALMACTPAQGSTISGAFRHGRPVFVEEMRQVDLVISGSVAVNPRGGAGWQGGRLRRPGVWPGHRRRHSYPGHPRHHHHPPHATAVRGPAPHRPRCAIGLRRNPGRGYPVLGRGALPHPKGIYWEDLDERKIKAIPLLQKLRERTVT